MKKTTANKLKHGDVYTVLHGDGTTLGSSVWICTKNEGRVFEHPMTGGSYDHTKTKHSVVFLYNVYKTGAKLTKRLNEKP